MSSSAALFKTVRNQDGGTAKEVGGDDWDRLADLLNGVANVANPKINSDWEYKYRRLWLRNQADTFSTNLASGPVTQNVLMTTPVTTFDDELVSRRATQELEGKTINGLKNNLLNLEGGGVAGKIQATRVGTGGSYSQGVLQGHIDLGGVSATPTTAVADAPYGIHWIYSTGTTIDTTIGIRFPPSTAFVRADFNPWIRFKYRTPVTGANNQLLLGFSTDGTISADQDPLLNTQSGFLVGYRHTPDTSFMIWRNGGTSTVTAQPILESAGGAAKGTALRTLEIQFSNGGQTVTVESRNVIGNTLHFGPFTYSTNLPVLSAPMYPVFQLTNRNTSNHELQLYRIDFKQDY